MLNKSLGNFDYDMEKAASDAGCEYDFEEDVLTEEDIKAMKAELQWDRRYEDF
jgi:hypothetical protein